MENLRKLFLVGVGAIITCTAAPQTSISATHAVNGEASSDAATAATPCWGIRGANDFRIYPSPKDAEYAPAALVEKLDALIAEKRTQAAAGTFDDNLSRSLYRRQIPFVRRRNFDVDVSKEDEAIPRAGAEIDWDRIWLKREEFRKVFQLVFKNDKELAGYLDAQLKKLPGDEELKTRSFVQLEMLKELILTQAEKYAHVKTVERAKVSPAEDPNPERRRFAFVYAEADDEQLAKRHEQALRTFCARGTWDEERNPQLKAVNDFFAEYTLRRDGAAHAHGLPASLKEAFGRLKAEERERFVGKIVAEMKYLAENPGKLRLDTTVLAHTLLMNGLGKKSFASVRLSSLVERDRAKRIALLEEAIKLADAGAAAADVNAARASLAQEYLLLASDPGTLNNGEPFAKAIAWGTEAAKLGANTPAGAAGARVAMQAFLALRPHARSAHLSPVSLVAEAALDERANPTWKGAGTTNLAHHALGEMRREEAGLEELRGQRERSSEKIRRAIAHLSTITDETYGGYHTARYQLAQAIFEESRGTDMKGVIRVLDGLKYPKEGPDSEVESYVRGRLLLVRALLLDGKPERVAGLVTSLEKEITANKFDLAVRPDVKESLERSKPSGDLQLAKAEFNRGKFEKVVADLDLAINRLERKVRDLEKSRRRDPSLELDLQDMRQLVLRALVRSNTPSTSAYQQWRATLSPMGVEAKHDRLLNDIHAEVAKLEGPAAAEALAHYREFFSMGLLTGMPHANADALPWAPPQELADTLKPEVTEAYRFLSEGYLLLGDHALKTGNPAQGQRDLEAAAVLLSRIKAPRLKELDEIHTAIQRAESALDTAIRQRNQAEEREARRVLATEIDRAKEKWKELAERQRLVVKAAGAFRRASAGQTDSPTFLAARRILEPMTLMETYDGPPGNPPRYSGTWHIELGSLTKVIGAGAKWSQDWGAVSSPIHDDHRWKINPNEMTTEDILTVAKYHKPAGRPRKGTSPYNPGDRLYELYDLETQRAKKDEKENVIIDRALERVDAYWYGHLDPEAQREYVLLWEEAAKHATRHNDLKAAYAAYARAFMSADWAMKSLPPLKNDYFGGMAYHPEASVLAFRSAYKDKPMGPLSAQGHEFWDKWLNNRLKWAETAIAIQKQTGTAPMVPAHFKTLMKALSDDAKKMEKIDKAQWDRKKDEYLAIAQKADQLTLR